MTNYDNSELMDFFNSIKLFNMLIQCEFCVFYNELGAYMANRAVDIMQIALKSKQDDDDIERMNTFMKKMIDRVDSKGENKCYFGFYQSHFFTLVTSVIANAHAEKMKHELFPTKQV